MVLRSLVILTLSSGIAHAALTITVTANPLNPLTQSDWTLSGSGVSGLVTPQNSVLLGASGGTIFTQIPVGAYDAVSGEFSIGGITATTPRVSSNIGTNSFIAYDGISLPFSATIAAGTDLSTASGTVTFPIPVDTIPIANLPELYFGPDSRAPSGDYFGEVSIVPEVSTVSLLGLFALAFTRRSRRA